MKLTGDAAATQFLKTHRHGEASTDSTHAFECNKVYHSSKTQVASDDGIDDACGYKAMLHEQTEIAIARMIALGLVAHARKIAQY